jgi:hypothetical protein
MNTGIIKAPATPLIDKAPRSLLSDVDAPYGSMLTKINDNIPTLSKFETKCLMLQIAYMESQYNVAAVTTTKFGKYQITEYLLQKYEYKDSNGWTGLDGVDTQDIFLASSKIQDKIIQKFLEENYSKLISAGAILENDTKDVVAGMLAVAYQFQDAENPEVIKLDKISSSILSLIKNEVNSNYTATKAKLWRNNGDQVDSSGRPGALYFNAGRYAVQNLAADVLVT